MKKLFSLILVALISSQMWGYKVYYGYGLGSSSTMGKYWVKYASTQMTAIPGKNESGWKTASASTTNYISPSTSQYVNCAALPADAEKYEFQGWYKETNDTSTTKLVSRDNPYNYKQSGTSAVYLYAVFKNKPAATPSTPATVLTAPPVVDFGPSVDVLWSTKNLGADNATDAGYYYAWGEIEPKDNYVSAGYTNPYTNFTDANDVARQKLGEGWRMPTKSEVFQLINYCTNTYSNTGITITGKGNYSNASIFIPRAGLMDGTNKNYTARVYLWTRSYYNNTQSYILFAQSSEELKKDTYYNQCYMGLPIRAVYAGTVAKATFKDGDGNTIKTQRVIPGTAPTAPATATKTATAQYTYTFTGWSSTVGNISSDKTYTAQFSQTTRSYTIKFVDGNGDEKQSSSYQYGDTPSYTGSTPTKDDDDDYTYEWTGGWDSSISEVTGDKTYTATFNKTPKAVHYTVTIGAMTNGTVTVSDGTNSITNTSGSVNMVVDPETQLTVTVTPATGYHLVSMSVLDALSNEIVLANDQFTPASNVTINATFDNQYRVVIDPYSNGTITLEANDGEGLKTVPAEGGTYKFAPATRIILNATKNSGCHFINWGTDEHKNKELLIDEIEADWTLAPSFAANKSCTLVDTWGETRLNDTITNRNGQVLRVTLDNRTFTAGQWATLSVPFEYNLTKDDALYGAVYRMNRAAMNGGSNVSLEFIRTYKIEANQPYLIVPRQPVTSVVFDGVEMTAAAAKVAQVVNGSDVDFVSALWQQVLDGGNGNPSAEKRVFYVGANSTLYFAKPTANGGTTLKGFRAFFRKTASAPAPRRVRIMLDGVEVEKEIAEDGTIEDVREVRKYMENGRLVIECNGVRMDATGKKIN